MDNVFYMKLMNGDDIVCQLEKEDEEHQLYIVTEPLKVNYNFSSEYGRMFLGLSRWIPLVESPYITIYFDHVVAMAKLQEEMNDFYANAIVDSEDELDEDEESAMEMMFKTVSANTQLH